MVDPDQPVLSHAPHARDGARRDSDALQARAHAGTLRVTYHVDVLWPQTRLAQGLLDQTHDPGAVVEGSVLG
jgi:hypothetical protein